MEKESAKEEIRDSRFEIRDSRFEIRDSRFEIRDSRFELKVKIHDARIGQFAFVLLDHDCGLDLIGSESCPPIDLVPCTTRCETKRLADPNDPLDSDEWACWNSEQENWQSQAIEPTNSITPVNKFSIDPLGGGKKLKPPTNAAPMVVCANFFECNCVMIGFGSYSCSKGPASGTSYLLNLVRSTDPCLTQVVNPPTIP